jgi:pimeloyl-ACP methyl ester carboxylesterase
MNLNAPATTPVDEISTEFLDVDDGYGCRRIAYRRRSSKKVKANPTGIVWLNGLRSHMGGTKATFLDRAGAETGHAILRFDYFGHGESSGRFEEGTIGLWLADALAAITLLTEGRQVIVGSSLGAWIALLVAKGLADRGEGQRLAGLVLLAPAVDFTEELVWARMPTEARAELEASGTWMRPSAYSTAPYPITKALIEEGRNHLLLGGTIRSFCPIHIVQGLADAEVPWQHATRLAEHFVGDPVTLTLVKDGDHRLSRDVDLARLRAAVDAMIAQAER